MARKQAAQGKGIGKLMSAAKAVKQLFTRGRSASTEVGATQPATARQSSQERLAAQNNAAAPTRPVQRPTDIHLALLDQDYTPHATSSKASFRSDGNDHQKDQSLAMSMDDERWNDEDLFTNKSGDPRIGTYRQTYEPAETRAETRD